MATQFRKLVGSSGITAGGGAIAGGTIQPVFRKGPVTSSVPTAPTTPNTAATGRKASQLHLTKPIFILAAIITVLHFVGGEL